MCKANIENVQNFVYDNGSVEFSIKPKPQKLYCKKTPKPYSFSDGADDMTQWEKCEAEMNAAFREPVAIECDVLLIDWRRLARIQV